MGQASSQQSSSTNFTAGQAAQSSQCPVQHFPSECPVKHDINPANQMPELSQLPGPSQTSNLSTDRTISSIPRPVLGTDATSTHWDYPSPQQFYNALLRKGWETPEEHVDTMVDIHNFLNEKAWEEVLNWEKRRPGAGEEETPQLARFMGRPGDLSPKARIFQLAGWLIPSKFNAEPPFDRHDWVIHRPKSKEDVRYVIDYYSAPPEPDGSPVFSLDVRPALDSWGSIRHRASAGVEDLLKNWAEERTNGSRSTQQKD